MLQARKNKTAGVLIDCEGKTHTYDFTECESDLLMSIHGHHHTEGFETYKGLTEFLFQSMLMNNANNDEPNCFYMNIQNFKYFFSKVKICKHKQDYIYNSIEVPNLSDNYE